VDWDCSLFRCFLAIKCFITICKIIRVNINKFVAKNIIHTTNAIIKFGYCEHSCKDFGEMYCEHNSVKFVIAVENGIYSVVSN
jgi:hypothetical protein